MANNNSPHLLAASPLSASQTPSPLQIQIQIQIQILAGTHGKTSAPNRNTSRALVGHLAEEIYAEVLPTPAADHRPVSRPRASTDTMVTVVIQAVTEVVGETAVVTLGISARLLEVGSGRRAAVLAVVSAKARVLLLLPLGGMLEDLDAGLGLALPRQFLLVPVGSAVVLVVVPPGARAEEKEVRKW